MMTATNKLSMRKEQRKMGAEEDEGDEVGVREGGAAGLERIDDFPRGLVELEGPGVAHPTGLAGKHDTRPGFAGGTPGNRKLGRFRAMGKIGYNNETV